ncbi:MAG: hypothetical protein LBT97_13545 [Planctomycetota bacterium]|jgi:hypothetical protein|nr:hypothetical protein [Planctomycetota bacterium]
MRELIDAVPGVDADIPRLPVFLIDLPGIAPGRLKGNPAVCALLDSLQAASSGRLGKRYEEIASRLVAVRDDSRARSWVWTFGGNRANRRPISSKDVAVYGSTG